MLRRMLLLTCLLGGACHAQDAAPTAGMDIWLRAEDVPGRVTAVSSWRSPPPLRVNAGAAQNTGEIAWRVGEQLAAKPALRLGERSSLLLSAPMQYQSFTLFAVARQAPGSMSGALVSSSRGEGQGIGWTEGKFVVVRAGAGKAEKLPFDGAAGFHVLTLRVENGAAFVFANGKPLNESPVALGANFGVQFVGKPASGQTLSGFEIMRALRMPANPPEGSDIAELILWPRALTDEEMRATLGFLHDKYALEFPPAAPGVFTAGAAKAAASAPVAAAGTADPQANYPTTVGRQFAKGSTCNSHALTPDQPGYCLYPPKNSVAWFRADDNFAMMHRLRSWSSPLYNELTQADESRQPELVNAQLGRYPVVRFENERHFTFTKPMELSRFSIFVVGRRTPGSGAGPIFGMGGTGTVYAYWSERGGLLLGEWQADPVAAFDYPDQDDFHLLALHGDGLVIRATVDGSDADSQPMPAGPGTFRIGQLGAGLRYWETLEHAVGRLADRGFSLTGRDVRISSEIAEILIYDRMLEPADVAQTERYLRRKYGLKAGEN